MTRRYQEPEERVLCAGCGVSFREHEVSTLGHCPECAKTRETLASTIMESLEKSVAKYAQGRGGGIPVRGCFHQADPLAELTLDPGLQRQVAEVERLVDVEDGLERRLRAQLADRHRSQRLGAFFTHSRTNGERREVIHSTLATLRAVRFRLDFLGRL